MRSGELKTAAVIVASPPAGLSYEAVAVEIAGGSAKDNCKRDMRSVARSYGIDDWPGYEDAAKHVFRVDEGARDEMLEKRNDIDDWLGYGGESKHVFHDSGVRA